MADRLKPSTVTALTRARRRALNAGHDLKRANDDLCKLTNEALQDGASLYAVAQALGVQITTVRRWRDRGASQQ